MSYRNITEFSDISNGVSDDPLTYCVPDILNSQFLHGGIGRKLGKYNRKCAEYMSSRCVDSWDGICEQASLNINPLYPDMMGHGGNGDCLVSTGKPSTAGDLLVRNTAFKKYMLNARNCNVQCESFDPTVGNSPLVCYISKSSCDGTSSRCATITGKEVSSISEGQCPLDSLCEVEYGLTVQQIQNIDHDPVMHKIIDKPCIAFDLLIQIYNNAKMRGIVSKLRGTRLGKFYESNGYVLA